MLGTHDKHLLISSINFFKIINEFGSKEVEIRVQIRGKYKVEIYNEFYAKNIDSKISDTFLCLTASSKVIIALEDFVKNAIFIRLFQSQHRND